jgi:hypothetical protein
VNFYEPGSFKTDLGEDITESFERLRTKESGGTVGRRRDAHRFPLGGSRGTEGVLTEELRRNQRDPGHARRPVSGTGDGLEGRGGPFPPSLLADRGWDVHSGSSPVLYPARKTAPVRGAHSVEAWPSTWGFSHWWLFTGVVFWGVLAVIVPVIQWVIA